MPLHGSVQVHIDIASDFKLIEIMWSPQNKLHVTKNETAFLVVIDP